MSGGEHATALAGSAALKPTRFHAAYRALEARMKARAEEDGDVFLPNPEPPRPVDHVFVCMEPSLGRWARSPEQARSKVEAGFRNFLASIDTMILHYCIRRYLCEPAQRYHITDLSKGAMLVRQASTERSRRYDRWYPLLLEELNLVATPEATIFAVGNTVGLYLKRKLFSRPFVRLIHYSGLAGRARLAGVAGHEEAFDRFRASITLRDVLMTAEEVLLASAVPTRLRDEILTQLESSQLSQSRRRLIFNYKLAFEAARMSTL